MPRNNASPRRLLIVALLSTLLAVPLAAQTVLDEFETKTTTHVLDNGWTFILVERPVAPVFSFATVVDVGGAQEVPGITGLAHMFEHMAFKGTPNIGTTDYAAEKKALDKVEAAYQAYETARRAPNADAAEVDELLQAFKTAQEEALQFVVPNEFTEHIERAGGVGVNAGTNSDGTFYFYSLPANKFELFAYLESERFLHPVFREFYKERDVVQEERRMRTESQPIGRLVEQALATAFLAHPYKQPVVGYMSDLQSFTATDAEEFYKKHYVPANMVTAIVGHLDPDKVIPLLEEYFGRIPAAPKPPPLRTVEPPQIAEKTVTLIDPSQPFYLEMYHVPSAGHPDTAVYQAIDDVLSNGRTSRLYRSLVRDKKIAAAAFSFSGFPGDKYPGLWIGVLVPTKGHTNEEVQQAMREEIERLKNEPISDEELDRFRTRAKADLLRGLDSNNGLAFQFAFAQTRHGDWRDVFHAIERIEKVTKDDIRRVARDTFITTNRTIAMIVTEDPNVANETDIANETDAGTPADGENG